MRTGPVAATTVDDVVAIARARLDKTIMRRTRPANDLVIPEFVGVGFVITPDQPAPSNQLLGTLAHVSNAVGLIKRAKAHDFRHSTVRDDIYTFGVAA